MLKENLRSVKDSSEPNDEINQKTAILAAAIKSLDQIVAKFDGHPLTANTLAEMSLETEMLIRHLENSRQTVPLEADLFLMRLGKCSEIFPEEEWVGLFYSEIRYNGDILHQGFYCELQSGKIITLGYPPKREGREVDYRD